MLHASFDRDDAARAAMEKCVALLHSLKTSADVAERQLLDEKEKEAQQFLKELGRPHPVEQGY